MAPAGSANAPALAPAGRHERWREFQRDRMEKLPPRSRYLNVSVIWIFYYPQVIRVLFALGVRHEVVTGLSIASGLAAAGLIASTSSYLGLLLAALLVHGKDLFDACDGALARLTGTGHRTGRFLDTIGDGIAFTALIAALAIRETHSGTTPTTVLLWSAAAWLSLFLQCSYFNYYQLHYTARVGGSTASRLDEHDTATEGPFLRMLVRIYCWWFAWQDQLIARWDERARRLVAVGGDVNDALCERWFTDRRFLIANSPLCYGTHAFVLMLCLVVDRPGWFFPAVVVVMNMYWGGIIVSRLAAYGHGNTR
jgi:phosphatidylglycerophosphate synthase